MARTAGGDDAGAGDGDAGGDAAYDMGVEKGSKRPRKALFMEGAPDPEDGIEAVRK